MIQSLFLLIVSCGLIVWLVLKDQGQPREHDVGLNIRIPGALRKASWLGNAKYLTEPAVWIVRGDYD